MLSLVTHSTPPAEVAPPAAPSEGQEQSAAAEGAATGEENGEAAEESSAEGEVPGSCDAVEVPDASEAAADLGLAGKGAGTDWQEALGRDLVIDGETEMDDLLVAAHVAQVILRRESVSPLRKAFSGRDDSLRAKRHLQTESLRLKQLRLSEPSTAPVDGGPTARRCISEDSSSSSDSSDSDSDSDAAAGDTQSPKADFSAQTGGEVGKGLDAAAERAYEKAREELAGWNSDQRGLEAGKAAELQGGDGALGSDEEDAPPNAGGEALSFRQLIQPIHVDGLPTELPPEATVSECGFVHSLIGDLLCIRAKEVADTFGPTSSPFYVVYVQPEVLAKAGDLLKEGEAVFCDVAHASFLLGPDGKALDYLRSSGPSAARPEEGGDAFHSEDEESSSDDSHSEAVWEGLPPDLAAAARAASASSTAFAGRTKKASSASGASKASKASKGSQRSGRGGTQAEIRGAGRGRRNATRGRGGARQTAASTFQTPSEETARKAAQTEAHPGVSSWTADGKVQNRNAAQGAAGLIPPPPPPFAGAVCSAPVPHFPVQCSSVFPLAQPVFVAQTQRLPPPPPQTAAPVYVQQTLRPVECPFPAGPTAPLVIQSAPLPVGDFCFSGQAPVACDPRSQQSPYPPNQGRRC